MKPFISVFVVCLLLSNVLKGQKSWVDDGVIITKLDTLADGFEALKGNFVIQNSSIHEVMNMIINVDGYDWVEGESTSKMLDVQPADSSFTFDFFVNIPWLFVKTTGRVKVDVKYDDGVLSTRSKQLKDYEMKEGYDQVDFYSAQWQLEEDNNDVKVTYLGVYKDVDMLINLNNIIISRIRKRLNGTFQNLIERSSNSNRPADKLVWPQLAN